MNCLTEILSLIISLPLLCSCGDFRFEAYPFGVCLGSSVQDFDKAVAAMNCTVGWEGSETYCLRRDRRVGIESELLDRTPEFGGLFFDHCMKDSLKFIARAAYNIPVPVAVNVFCSAAVEDGRVSSLNCVHFLDDFDDVSSVVRKYVGMLDARYGHYEPLSSILSPEGDDFSSLSFFGEGAFLWKRRGHRVELFVNKYQLLRDVAFRDMGPMERYEVILRYR